VRKSIRYTLRLAALIAVVVVLPALLVSPTPAHTPYASALSNLTYSPAYAMGCPDKICLDRTTCTAGAGYKCLHFNGKGCLNSLCG
jgi:hypothetical protein